VRRRRIAIVSLTWSVVAGAWFWYRWASGLGTTDAAQQLVDRTSGAWWAVAAFLLVSILRPFVLFPATLLTMAAGLLFGPVAGVVVAAAGANASAMVGHTVGSAFTADVERDGRLAGWRSALRSNSFESILLMRLVFLPYDLVNYAAGYLGVARVPFLAATAIGSLPGTVSFVLLGASLSNLADGTAGIEMRTLVASIVLIVASIVVARLLRRRTGTLEDSPATDPLVR
jgi:uncharacterized membrane protein YdjX (TVP38/TMEM64 family)